MTNKPSRKSFRSRLDEMVAVLREDIIIGTRAAGDFLPSEHDLGIMFQLSNKSVRKGLDTLVEEKLIEKIPRVGNKVAQPSADGGITIKFGYYQRMSVESDMESLVAEFHRRYPHIQVQLVKLPSHNYQPLVKEFLETEMLDVITLNVNNYEEFIENDCIGLLQPLDSNPELYSFLHGAFEQEGPLRAQPFTFSPVILCYNRQHFQEKGLLEPDSGWTWQDLIRSAEQLAVENERFGFYFHILARNRWPIFPLQSGMDFERDKSGQYRLCGTRLMESFRVCRDMIYLKNVFPIMLSASDADAEELFLQGKVSMIMTTYFGLNNLREASFPLDIAPVPHLHDYRTLLLVIGLAINRKSKMQEAAKLFVDFMVSYEAQLKMRQNTLSIPSLKKAAEWVGEESVTRPSRFSMYREIIPTLKLITDMKLTSKERHALLQEVKLYWSLLQDEATFCSRVEKALGELSGQEELHKLGV
jgi:multiple sugar transport system substrate-binding protein